MLTCFDFNYYYTLDVNVSSSRNYTKAFNSQCACLRGNTLSDLNVPNQLFHSQHFTL